MKKHIHIVGCSPRSGTTLMQELMISCFEVDDYCEHEKSIFKSQGMEGEVVCTKQPAEMMYMPWLLRLEPELYSIYMLRDPRSVITSRHGKSPNKYWAGLRFWKENEEIRKSLNHPRFLMIKYEDLVAEPDKVQDVIASAMPFLKKKHNFSEFQKYAKPSESSCEALNGLRPVSSASVEKWKGHLARVKYQFDLFGDVSDQLIELGYEEDRLWMEQLDSVDVDVYESETVNNKSSIKIFRIRYRVLRKTVEFLLKKLIR